MAPVFDARKAAEDRQQKLWNGSTEALYYSERDAETFFDVLQVPLELQIWLGQEAVQAVELCMAGNWTLLELSSLVDDLSGEMLRGDFRLHPAHGVQLVVCCRSEHSVVSCGGCRRVERPGAEHGPSPT